MPNLNPNPAQVVSAPLITEDFRPTAAAPAAPVAAAPAVQKAESLSTGEQVKFDTYTVKRGDTLWDIAGVKLGDNKKWPLLFALNKDQIKNPDLIYPGQVLTIPQKVEVAPPAPPTNIPSPVDPEPPPVVVAEPEIPAAPVQVEPEVPAVVPQPVQEAPVLKPPSELPEPAPEAPPAPIQEAPPVAPEPTAPPIQPVVEPVAGPPPGSVIGQPPVAVNQGSGVGKAALIGGTVGAIATGAVLIGVTKSLAPPLSNLGGYATAQIVSKSVNSVIGKVGLHVPAGPALAKIVSKVGGPKTAGAVTALAVGAVVAGVAAGGYYLYSRNSKPAPAAQPQPAPTGPAPQQAAQASSAPQAATAAEAATGSADNLQPVANDPNAARTELMKQLQTNLSQKTYFGYGSVSKPEETSQLSEQIWVGATEIDHRLDLAKALVSNGQSVELGRIMGNSGVSDLEVAQLMAQPGFPTKEFMAGIDDNKATLILVSLSNVATTGEPETARLLNEIATSFTGRFKDRETPFVRLKAHHENQGSWTQIPAEVRSSIEKLIK
jgi:LysM repeat protein